MSHKHAVISRLTNLGIAYDDAESLRRISMTLHRCGCHRGNPKNKLYVGIVEGGVRQVFRCNFEPTFETHGDQYLATIGPFRTKRGAQFMADYGRDNPHCVCVRDAEQLARRYQA